MRRQCSWQTNGIANLTISCFEQVWALNCRDKPTPTMSIGAGMHHFMRRSLIVCRPIILSINAANQSSPSPVTWDQWNQLMTKEYKAAMGGLEVEERKTELQHLQEESSTFTMGAIDVREPVTKVKALVKQFK
jgi:hypothetical protein